MVPCATGDPNTPPSINDPNILITAVCQPMPGIRSNVVRIFREIKRECCLEAVFVGMAQGFITLTT